MDLYEIWDGEITYRDVPVQSDESKPVSTAPEQ
jgi:hypothetical protein